MTLFTPKSFERFALSQKAATIVYQWGSCVGKVGGKVFALMLESGQSISIKVSEMSFEGLTEIAGIAQAPYFAKRQWVSVDRKADLAEADLKAYIGQSYKMVAAKLTRKLRAELGIEL